MNRDVSIKRFERQIEESRKVEKLHRFSPEFKKWKRDTEVLIEKSFPPGRHSDDFARINYNRSSVSNTTTERDFQAAFEKGMADARSILQSFIQEIEEYGDDNGSSSPALGALEIVCRLCQRMPIAIQQLRRRHNKRPTLEVNDEYDLQDLLHGVLRLHFDDVRAEDPAPTHAGASTRLDFVLKSEQIVVETKMTRKGLGAKEIGEEILVDIGRYQAHPDCKTLACLVYDPDGLVRNPRGLETDLAKKHGELEVIVFVVA